MHPKNPFQNDYNFDELIKNHEALKEHVFINKYGTKTISFADHRAVKALNSALLKFHYGVHWDIPDQYLCPPIPGRLDYLLYVSDLLNKPDITMLDIGTGANLIYPILGTKHFNWTCVGSDVDTTALDNAKAIIHQNEALKNIDLIHQPYGHNIFEYVIEPEDYFDVVVCNPPFNKDKEEAQKANHRKVKNLKLKASHKLNFGGMSNELVFEGGEIAFIKQMALESSRFKKQVHWFTSLISKQDNLPSIIRAVKHVNPSDFRIIEMELGNKKSRFIAWTFR